jgi:hypothetical protein
VIRLLGEGESLFEDLIKILIDVIENRLVFYENPLLNEPGVGQRKKLLKLLFNLEPLLIKDKDEHERSSRMKKQTPVLTSILSKELDLQKNELDDKISEIFQREYEYKVPTSYTGLRNRFLAF